MQPAEARRQEVIDPGDEGDAGDGAEPGAGAAEAGDDGEARRERGHPPEPEPVADVIRGAGRKPGQAIAPSTTAGSVGRKRAQAPALLSHLPAPRPRRLSTVTEASVPRATEMNHAGEASSGCAPPPVTHSALPAAKYSIPAK